MKNTFASRNNCNNIKYLYFLCGFFSKSYHKEFDIPADLLGSGKNLELDLGIVSVMADVYLNDRNLGLLWKPPFRSDITQAAKPGKNRLMIEVANTWSNRIVGDTKLPEGKRYTRTNIMGPKTWEIKWEDAPLLESGLMGPVRLLPAERIKMNLTQ